MNSRKSNQNKKYPVDSWMEELEAANVIQGFGRKQLMIIRLLIMKRGGDSRAILIIKRGEHDPYFDGDIFRFNTIMIFS